MKAKIVEFPIHSLVKNENEKILAIATWCNNNEIFQFSKLIPIMNPNSEYFSAFELRKIVDFLNTEARMNQDPDGLILIKNMNVIYSMANESIPAFDENEDQKDREFWGDDRND